MFPVPPGPGAFSEMNTPHRSWLLAVGVMTVVTSLRAQAPAPAASASGSIEEAQRRYQRARELYDENNFSAALVEMRRAHELSRSYKLLYDIGQICYQTHDYPCALQSFGRFLDEGKSEIAPARRDEVQAEIGRLKARVASVRVTATAGAEVLLDDAVVGTAPLSESVMVGAGRHRLSARRAGREPVARQVDVAGGDTLEVNLSEGTAGTAGPVATASADVGAPSSRSVPWIGWGITGALAVGAGVVGVLALKASSDYSDRLDTVGSTHAQVSDAHDRMRTRALVTDILLGATVVAGGVSLYFTLSSKGSTEPPTRVTTTIGPRGFLLQGSF